jgi:hypothetical protein
MDDVEDYSASSDVRPIGAVEPIIIFPLSQLYFSFPFLI